MDLFRAKFRRWAAGIFLGASGLMLVLGLTEFSGRLAGIDFLTYWLVCFLFTGLAAIFAITEMAAIRRDSRDEQRELIRETLEHAAKESNEPRKPDSRK